MDEEKAPERTTLTLTAELQPDNHTGRVSAAARRGALLPAELSLWITTTEA